MNPHFEAATPYDEALAALVSARLAGTWGPAVSHLHDERPWALLLAEFPEWRNHAAKLAAVNAALKQSATEAAKAQNWDLLKNTCEFAHALASYSPPWLAPSVAKLPFDQWLKHPLESETKGAASMAVYRLMCIAGKANPDTRYQLFTQALTQAVSAEPTQAIEWLLICWYAVLTQDVKPPRWAEALPWYELFTHLSVHWSDSWAPALARRAIAQAWLSAPSEARLTLVQAAISAGTSHIKNPSHQKELLELFLQEFKSTKGVNELLTRELKALGRAKQIRTPTEATHKSGLQNTATADAPTPREQLRSIAAPQRYSTRYTASAFTRAPL